MAPSKKLKIMDPVLQSKKDCTQQLQDGDDPMLHSPASEGPMELEGCSLSQDYVPVTNKSLHTMLQDLKGSLRADLRQITVDLHKDIQDLGGRTSHLESKTEEFCTAHNDAVEKLHKLEEEQAAMRLKIGDMEDRARRNNLRFRGIVDAITSEGLPQYLMVLFKALLLHLDGTAWTFNRVHHLPRHARFTADTSEDTTTMAPNRSS
ncbi:Hypothetical predicted protein [Pelobates cultripes]|uniref:Uncharacterized protein n=1 Tax=Pelobates cultripes TaxID=61616 RepID=A0AAD1VT01_PELCU|nr:Hypothetical predicted protein [Pelobates cultripes]